MSKFYKKDNKYWYRLFLSEWGILFGFNIKVLNCEEYNDDFKVVVPGLKFSVKDNQLTVEEIQCIEDGLNIIAQYFIQISPYKTNSLIELSDFEISDCDFQKEGLTDAIIEWSKLEFNINAPNVNVHYDKRKNKYVFNFR